MDELDTYTTKRGSEAPLVNCYKFRLNRTKGSIKYWKYSNDKAKCKAICQNYVKVTQNLAGHSAHNRNRSAQII